MKAAIRAAIDGLYLISKSNNLIPLVQQASLLAAEQLCGLTKHPLGRTIPQLVARIRDIVGLYMNPPVNAAVFAVDEKPQIQALNRTAPMLPTTAQRRSHDYRRNGTIDLFAALDIASEKVISELRPNHTSAQFIKFLNKINREVPKELDVHVVLDNLSTHKTPAGHKWLLRHRRFHSTSPRPTDHG